MTKKHKVRLFALAFWALLHPLRADSWMRPTDSAQRSDNGQFLAQVFRSQQASRIVVSELRNQSTNKLWEAACPNTPVQAFLSQNGSNVVTLDSWGGTGYGNHVVVLYSSKGKLAQHSLESFAPSPSGKTNDFFSAYRNVFPHSTSSRQWRENSFDFFSPDDNPTAFCIWLAWRHAWTAFDLQTGAARTPTPTELEDINARATKIAIADFNSQNPGTPNFMGANRHVRALKFVASSNSADTPKLVEEALASRSFDAGIGAINDAPAILIRSALRAAADKAAVNLGRKVPQTEGAPDNDPIRSYVHLGDLEGAITFPKNLPKIGFLHLYLHPTDRKADPNEPLPQSFTVPLSQSYRKIKNRLLLDVETLTPGQYRLEVIADITAPFSKTSWPHVEPSPGDYCSTNSPSIQIHAGQRTSGIKINCVKRP